MKATKHYEHDHVIVYLSEDSFSICITLSDEQQLRRAGECLTDLARLGGSSVEIKK